jgi:hypothetical protein
MAAWQLSKFFCVLATATALAAGGVEDALEADAALVGAGHPLRSRYAREKRSHMLVAA